MIDQFAKKLHREVDDFKVGAKDMIKTNASNTWNRKPITSTQQVAVNTLANISEVRASLENEIRCCEMDELTMAKRSNQMDALSDQLEAFLQSQIQLPAAYKFDLMTQRTQLLTSISEVEHKVLLLMEAFVQTFNTRVMFSNPKTVRLFEQRLFNEQSRPFVRPIPKRES